MAWNADSFKDGLYGSLRETLAGTLDEAILRRTLVTCVETADAVCARRPVDCGPGCPHCCVLNVAVLLPEALVIAAWLQHLPSLELDHLRASLRSHHTWARWMDDEERRIKQVRCPLLATNGNCSIHPVRPLVCRAAASLDRKQCLEAFSSRVDDDHDCTVPVDLVRQAAYDATFATLAQVLRSVSLDDRSIELSGGVLAFLNQPELQHAFLSGQTLPRTLWD